MAGFKGTFEKVTHHVIAEGLSIAAASASGVPYILPEWTARGQSKSAWLPFEVCESIVANWEAIKTAHAAAVIAADKARADKAAADKAAKPAAKASTADVNAAMLAMLADIAAKLNGGAK